MAKGKYEAKVEKHGSDLIRLGEKQVMLRVVDHSWKDHLLALDHLKEGINLRGYGQRDPLNEYKRESYELFEEMRNRIEDTITRHTFRMEPVSPEEMMERERQRREAALPTMPTRCISAPPTETWRRFRSSGRRHRFPSCTWTMQCVPW